MTHEILTGIQDIIEVWGKLSWCMIPAIISAEIFNRLMKKIYPAFNPKMSWKSNGSILQALPSFIIIITTTLYVGQKLKNYQFPNILIPLLGIIIFGFLYKKSYLESSSL